MTRPNLKANRNQHPDIHPQRRDNLQRRPFHQKGPKIHLHVFDIPKHIEEGNIAAEHPTLPREDIYVYTDKEGNNVAKITVPSASRANKLTRTIDDVSTFEIGGERYIVKAYEELDKDICGKCKQIGSDCDRRNPRCVFRCVHCTSKDHGSVDCPRRANPVCGLCTAEIQAGREPFSNRPHHIRKCVGVPNRRPILGNILRPSAEEDDIGVEVAALRDDLTVLGAKVEELPTLVDVKKAVDTQLTEIFSNLKVEMKSNMEEVAKMAAAEVIKAAGGDEIVVRKKIRKTRHLEENQPPIASCFKKNEEEPRASEEISLSLRGDEKYTEPREGTWINGEMKIFIVDTCSKTSIIDSKTFHLCRAAGRVSSFKPSEGSIETWDGHQLLTMGTARVTLDIGEPHEGEEEASGVSVLMEVLEEQSMATEMVLGMNFLRSVDAEMCFDAGSPHYGLTIDRFRPRLEETTDDIAGLELIIGRSLRKCLLDTGAMENIMTLKAFHEQKPEIHETDIGYGAKTITCKPIATFGRAYLKVQFGAVTRVMPFLVVESSPVEGYEYVIGSCAMMDLRATISFNENGVLVTAPEPTPWTQKAERVSSHEGCFATAGDRRRARALKRNVLAEEEEEHLPCDRGEVARTYAEVLMGVRPGNKSSGKAKEHVTVTTINAVSFKETSQQITLLADAEKLETDVLLLQETRSPKGLVTRRQCGWSIALLGTGLGKHGVGVATRSPDGFRVVKELCLNVPGLQILATVIGGAKRIMASIYWAPSKSGGINEIKEWALSIGREGFVLGGGLQRPQPHMGGQGMRQRKGYSRVDGGGPSDVHPTRPTNMAR